MVKSFANKEQSPRSQNCTWYAVLNSWDVSYIIFILPYETGVTIIVKINCSLIFFPWQHAYLLCFLSSDQRTNFFAEILFIFPQSLLFLQRYWMKFFPSDFVSTSRLQILQFFLWSFNYLSFFISFILNNL